MAKPSYRFTIAALALALSCVPATVAGDDPVCGNDMVEDGETCDPPGEPAGEPNECRADCTFCGDGVVDMMSMKDDADGEACDDGNNDGGDGCRADCTIEECGDGIVDPGEGCDDGNDATGDGCRPDCTAEVCGDGIVDADEGCDDGNDVPGDGCRADCTVEICGDTILDAPAETCDPPGEPAGEVNECRSNCTFCGDGIVDMDALKDEAAGEVCDDGNNDGGDGCRSDCTAEICGDGIVDPGEECDDGNDDNTDTCRNDCTDGALLVVLESFTATVTDDGVRIEWVTALEVDTVGFRLSRARAASRRPGLGPNVTPYAMRLHEGLLPAAGSELDGARYEFLDNAPIGPGTYHYILEDVDLFGRVTRHAPARVVIVSPGREAPAGRVDR